LYKRVFFHLDGRYPNGVSIPVFTEDLQKWGPERASFVEHPEYGWCFAEEKYRVEKGKEKQYLRLYKMSDAVDEINRRLKEAADGAFP
jgi:hypothetical protein